LAKLLKLAKPILFFGKTYISFWLKFSLLAKLLSLDKKNWFFLAKLLSLDKINSFFSSIHQLIIIGNAQQHRAQVK
jgi:hypothetical protein